MPFFFSKEDTRTRNCKGNIDKLWCIKTMYKEKCKEHWQTGKDYNILDRIIFLIYDEILLINDTIKNKVTMSSLMEKNTSDQWAVDSRTNALIFQEIGVKKRRLHPRLHPNLMRKIEKEYLG